MTWILFLCLLTSTVLRARGLSEDNKAELNAKFGETILIKKWSLNDTTLSIIVKGANITLLNTVFPGDNEKIQKDRLMLKYNLTSNEASLIFINVSREDECLYQIEESFYRTKSEPHHKHEEKDGRWNFQLNVFEPGEVATGYVGENVIMDFSKPSKLSFLYHYDKKVAIIHEHECRLFLCAQFSGRVRSLREEFNTTCTIIIQNVTQRDAGLYKVVREDTLMERRFLDITGTTTTSTTNPATLQGSETKNQLHQISSEAYNSQRISLKLSTLDAGSAGIQLRSFLPRSQASSMSTQSTKPMRIPDYVIPVVVGVVGVIMLMIGFLIWMQRRKKYYRDTEKCETASFATPTTVRRTIPMPAWEEGRADRSVPRAKSLHDAILGLNCSSAPRNAASVDTLYRGIYSLERCVDDKPRPNNIMYCNESSKTSNILSASCDGDKEMGICPSVCTLVSASGREEYKTICTVQRQVAKRIQALFEKVYDEPNVSSKYYKSFTTTGNADSLYSDEFKMAAISSSIDPEEKFQDGKIASESTKTRAASCLGTSWTREKVVYGTEEDHGYDTSENICK